MRSIRIIHHIGYIVPPLRLGRCTYVERIIRGAALRYVVRDILLARARARCSYYSISTLIILIVTEIHPSYYGRGKSASGYYSYCNT